MMQFFLLAGVLLSAAYLLFIPALRAKSQNTEAKPAQPGLMLYQQRRQELEQELALGNLDQAGYEQLGQELDLQLLDDSQQPDAPVIQSTSRRWPILLLLLILPFFGFGLYSYLGRPDLLVMNDQPTGGTNDAHAMDSHIQRLAQHLANAPDDVQGWMLLGRSYQFTHQAKQAQAAYEKAMGLEPHNMDIKALYAEAIAETQNNRLQGRPAEIIAEILKADANHPTGLWLAGLAAVEQGDTKTALAHWEKLKALTPADSEDAKQLDGYIATLAAQPGATVATAKLSIMVNVSLAPALADKVQPNDTLFVFAKAASGPAMPLVVVRKQVKDLPLQISLDDSMAMNSSANLSTFPQIVLGARISKSGQPAATAGDLLGVSAPIKPVSGQSYRLEINQLKTD